MNNTWSDDGNIFMSNLDEENDKFTAECKNEFYFCLKKWRQHYKDINWHESFPNFDKNTTALFDLIDDMLPLDVGPFYVALLEKSNSGKHPLFGFIPLIEISSQHNIGVLNAESFSERIISIGNIVMTDRKSLLGDNEYVNAYIDSITS